MVAGCSSDRTVAIHQRGAAVSFVYRLFIDAQKKYQSVLAFVVARREAWWSTRRRSGVPRAPGSERAKLRPPIQTWQQVRDAHDVLYFGGRSMARARQPRRCAAR